MTRIRAMLSLLSVVAVVAPASLVSSENITITVTIQQAQLAGVELRPPPDKRGRSGDTLTYRFRLQNTGNGTDQFAITITSNRGWFIIAPPGGQVTDPLTPGPGGGSRTTVEVNVTIPVDETIGTEDVLTLTATSEFDPSVSAQAQVTTTVRRGAGGPP